jgi:SAM-dependent methyltransferase
MEKLTGKILRRLKIWQYNIRSLYVKKVFLPMRGEMTAEAVRFLLKKKLIETDTDIAALGSKWPELVKASFDPSDPDDFYSKWTGQTGASNIIANINDQFGRYYMHDAMAASLGTDNGFSGTVLDFGCGTGALSMAWQRKYCGRAKLLLADVDNLAAEFVRDQIQKHADYNTAQLDICLSKLAGSSVDVLVCAHVLEHLKNPSEVFASIESRLKTGGWLIIDAPWGGHPEHLHEAPVDWETNGGAVLLKEKYAKMRGLNPYSGLSGLYKKKS